MADWSERNRNLARRSGQRQRGSRSVARVARRYFGMITRLRIYGMSCQHCVQAVFTSLTPIEGIRSAQVTIGAATIEHDGRATVAALREAIAVSGYEVALAEEDRRTLH
jgi:copper chaperone